MGPLIFPAIGRWGKRERLVHLTATDVSPTGGKHAEKIYRKRVWLVCPGVKEHVSLSRPRSDPILSRSPCLLGRVPTTENPQQRIRQGGTLPQDRASLFEPIAGQIADRFRSGRKKLDERFSGDQFLGKTNHLFGLSKKTSGPPGVLPGGPFSSFHRGRPNFPLAGPGD